MLLIQKLNLNIVLRNRQEPTLVQLSRCTSRDSPPEWIQIACGVRCSAGLTRNGEVYTWGWNNAGQLGHDDDDRMSVTIPTKVKSLNGIIITQISCGNRHMAAVSDKGEVFTWYVPI